MENHHLYYLNRLTIFISYELNYQKVLWMEEILHQLIGALYHYV